MKKLRIFVITIIFIISIFTSLNVYATSNNQLESEDPSVELSEDEYEENSIRSVPGGEEPDNEDWYGIELDDNGMPIIDFNQYSKIDYTPMPNY